MSLQPGPIDGALSRFLHAAEHSAVAHVPTLPWVIEGLPNRRSLAACFDLVTAQRHNIMEGLHRWGAVLLRGFDVPDGGAFTEVLSRLGLELDTTFDLEPSMRKLSSARSFESWNHREDVFLGPHTEMAYSWSRPKYLGFHCELAALQFGETPIFDFQAVLNCMTPSLRERFERVPMLFTRWFTSEYVDSKYQGDVARLEAALQEGGYEFEHLEGDPRIRATCLIPSVIQHPITGAAVFNFPWYWGRAYTFPFFVETIRLYPDRAALGSDKIAKMDVPVSPYEELMEFSDGKRLSPEQIVDLCRLTWEKSTLFPWIEGDVLILDNARIGHAKSPNASPRKINAAIADLFNIRDHLLSA